MTAWFHNVSSYIQKNAAGIYILSTKNEAHLSGFFVYNKSIRQVLAFYCARSTIKSTWGSNTDIYLQPISEINT
jgi:hypothetical protein